MSTIMNTVSNLPTNTELQSIANHLRHACQNNPDFDSCGVWSRSSDNPDPWGATSEVEISCVIYNNTKVNYYNNRTLDGVVHYKGQNSGRQDSLIKAGKTLYLEKPGNEVCTYVGLVTGVEFTSTSPINEFKLTLDLSHEQNGYKSGDKLEYVEGVKKGRGSCWTKRSALIRLGFASDKGNFVSGIIPVKPGNELWG